FTLTHPAERSTPSLHDALPIWSTTDSAGSGSGAAIDAGASGGGVDGGTTVPDCEGLLPALSAQNVHQATYASLNGACGMAVGDRSEEHTSELQSRGHLVCRLLL